MKSFRQWPYAIVFLFGVIISLSNAAGRADTQNQGNTGAPGDEIILASGQPRTCQSCHNGGSFNASLQLALTDLGGNAVSAYQPGQKYMVSGTMLHGAGTPAGYGMQMVALINDGDIDVAGWSAPLANTKIATASSNGRSYIEQDNMSSTPLFGAEWTAPSAGSGSVTIYACGNVVNGNQTSSGDNAAIGQLLIEEQTSSAENLNNTQPALSLYHNTQSNQLVLQTNMPEAGEYLVRVFDLSGCRLFETRLALFAGKQRSLILAPELPAGAVLVQLSGRGRQFTAKGLITK